MHQHARVFHEHTHGQFARASMRVFDHKWQLDPRVPQDPAKSEAESLSCCDCCVSAEPSFFGNTPTAGPEGFLPLLQCAAVQGSEGLCGHTEKGGGGFRESSWAMLPFKVHDHRCTTDSGSQSRRLPVLTSTPKLCAWGSLEACCCRKRFRMSVASKPALSQSCRGMTSKALAKALMNSCDLPAMVRA